MLRWILTIIGIAFYFWWMRRRRKKAQKGEKKDAFSKMEMRTVRECKKCKKTRTRKFKRGDYVFKDDKKCKCGQKTIITGIYTVKVKTKKELKWEKEFKKWQY